MSDDIALDEKRVYGDRRDRTVAFVAAESGVVRVELSGDQVGRFSLVAREAATDIAGGDGWLVVATDEDVLVGTGDGFEPTDFGRAAAVAVADGVPVAVGPEGRVARLRGDAWESVGSVAGPRHAEGDLVAASGGVYRVGETLSALGDPPGEVRDLASTGSYAATDAGLYRHGGSGWDLAVEGDCRLVAADGQRACVVTGSGVLVRRDGEWRAVDRPDAGPLAGIAYGENLSAVTAEGTVLVRVAPDQAADGRGGWRSRALGVHGIVGLAVP